MENGLTPTLAKPTLASSFTDFGLFNFFEPKKPKPKDPFLAVLTLLWLWLLWLLLVWILLDHLAPDHPTTACARPPNAGPTKISLFPSFSLPHFAFSVSLGVFSPPGFHTTARELQTCMHISGPGASKHHQNSTRRHPERHKSENGGGRGKKKREILGLPPFQASPSGPHFSGRGLKGVSPPLCGGIGQKTKTPILAKNRFGQSRPPKIWPKFCGQLRLAKVGQHFLAKVGLAKVGA